VAGATIVSYSVYSIESRTAMLHPHLWVTVPIVLFGFFRYLYLVYQKGWGGAPEEALLKDRTMQMALAAWVATVLFLFAFDRPGITLT
ncbi:MAG TPA: decaprenyl-phosphate phosphoribosyltransferase, partial [Chthonomonadales bacterium]|nr:decaprenyl-phosphate phosphoribosyltransferase [Chthonomonadales bacterium]